MSVKVEVPQEPEKAIVRVPSFSSSAATEVGYNASEKVDGYHSSPMNWKRELSNPACTKGEPWTSQLRVFRGCIYSWAKTITQAPYAQSSYPLTGCWAWNWTLPQLQADSSDVVADTLSQQSSGIFQRIPFDELVREASEQSSQVIESFRWQYEALSWRLFRWCVGKQDKKERLNKVQESIQKIAADPFILDTIESTCQSVEKESYSKPKLEQLSRLLIQPLQAVLHQPTSVNDVQLRMLEIRFRRQYHSLETKWEQPLETKDNELLQQVGQTDIPVVAESLSRDDHALYQQLEIEAITRNYHEPNQVRHDLNRRWNHLCRSVEECIAAGAGIDMKIVHLAQALHQRSNYYSLTAVVQGTRASGGPRQTLQEFGHLVNWEQNYRAYRENMGDSAGLHFLAPAAIAARQGDYTVGRTVIEACEAYKVGSLYAAASTALPKPGGSLYSCSRSLSSATAVNADGYFRNTAALMGYSTTAREPMKDSVLLQDIEDESRCVSSLMLFFSCFAN